MESSHCLTRGARRYEEGRNRRALGRSGRWGPIAGDTTGELTGQTGVSASTGRGAALLFSADQTKLEQVVVRMLEVAARPLLHRYRPKHGMRMDRAGVGTGQLDKAVHLDA